MNNTSTTLNHNSRFSALFWWLATVVWAGFIFYLSSGAFGSSWTEWLLRQILQLLNLIVSPHFLSILNSLVRKLAHITEYAILGFFLYGCFAYQHQFEWRAKTAWGCILTAGLYALTDEFHQRFVPGRDASLFDCGIDIAGAALSMLALYLYGSERFFQAKSRRARAGGKRTEGI